MNENDKFLIKEISKYCKTILKGGAEDYIIKYDYYLSKASGVLIPETDKYKENEKAFLLLNIKAIKETIKNIEFDSELNGIGKVAILNNYFESLAYLYKKLNTILNREKTSKNTTKNNLLLKGKKLNISERYEIANKIFNVYETANKKNISQTEKHILIAHLLGCNQQTARELFNGTQVKRTPIREDILNSYLDNLK